MFVDKYVCESITSVVVFHNLGEPFKGKRRSVMLPELLVVFFRRGLYMTLYKIEFAAVFFCVFKYPFPKLTVFHGLFF